MYEQMNLFSDEVIDSIEFVENDKIVKQCKLGDIWRLGNHYLYCNNSTDIDKVKRFIQGVKVNMLYTDPPYGMKLDTDYSVMENKLNISIKKSLKGGNKYEQGIVDTFDKKMVDVMLSLDIKEKFLWGGNYYCEYIKEKNDGSWIVWDKRSNNNHNIKDDEGSDKMFGSCFELCWSKQKHKQDIARVKWAGIFGLEQEFDKKRYHPTQKPIALTEWFLTRYTKKHDVVLDLFGGSGSTLLGCQKLDRICYTMELDPHYCDIIIHRWEKMTGSKAELIEERE